MGFPFKNGAGLERSHRKPVPLEKFVAEIERASNESADAQLNPPSGNLIPSKLMRGPARKTASWFRLSSEGEGEPTTSAQTAISPNIPTIPGSACSRELSDHCSQSLTPLGITGLVSCFLDWLRPRESDVASKTPAFHL